MTLQEELDTFRKATPGCTLTAFGDLSSGLILRSSTDAALPREVLDRLCSTAAQSFALLGDAGMPETADKDIFAKSVIAFTAQQSQIFTRASHKAEDVICAVVDTAQPIEPILNTARTVCDACAEDTA